jgi:hypothetical protein
LVHPCCAAIVSPQARDAHDGVVLYQGANAQAT